jgi:hypothetical protein
MARTIPYSPAQVDLYTPARRGNFFHGGWPQPPATLCAEMARLAYGLKYEHLGDPYYIDGNGNIAFAPPEDSMRDDRLRAAADYLLKFAWKPGNVGVRELADHATINYVWAVKANESQP